ncbi:O-antigen ligase-like membrane protein [Flavobacterium aquaticum]|uniref:O-antigen ligase-like membrane protein n=1 Tax=Flavobacterium aquaticum TaxID=1236486 RepID=A0A327YRX7_9FLAO|nr:O-antigen ligase family protein [Flavobacterium aquaticum]RAK23653.1 O-antigen ligase-like membrane protein [Flavobacterium aquaticum]
MKLNLDKYLLYSSVFAIFSEGFFFNFIIDWKLLYLIIFVNYFLIIKYKTLRVHKTFLIVVASLFAHAILCYTIIQIPPNYFISQLLGITITGLYFYNFFLVAELSKVTKLYLSLSFYIAILGLIFYFLKLNPFAYFDNEFRLMSIFKEPAHFVVVILPACYFFLRSKLFLKFFVLFVSIILSESSLGYIGCGMMFIFPFFNLKKFKYLLVAVPLVLTLFFYTYKNFESFQMRVDDSMDNLTVLKNGKFDESTNLSSYVMLTNLYIAKQNIIEHPLGSGIGSHHYMFTTRYHKTMRPPNYINKLGHKFDNSFDANSLFTRISSEFGIIGIICVIFFLIRSFNLSFSNSNFILQGILIYFLLKLFRDGTYFPPELFFFIWMFYFTNQKITE